MLDGQKPDETKTVKDDASSFSVQNNDNKLIKIMKKKERGTRGVKTGEDSERWRETKDVK